MNVVIRTKFKLHQRIYESDISISRQEYGLLEKSWVWQSLKHEGARSQLRRCQSSEVRAVLEVLRRLQSRPSWLQIANTSFDRLDIALVIDAFRLVEREILTVESWGDHSRHNASLRSRALFKRFLEDAQLPLVDRLTVYFKSSIPNQRLKNHRKLISDQPIQSADTLTPPIGALPHLTIKELEASTTKALGDVLDRISEACRKELDLIERVRRKHIELVNGASESVVTRLTYELQTRYHASDWLKGLAISKLARAYLYIAANAPDEIERRGGSQRAPRSAEVVEYFAQQAGVRWRSPFLLYFPLGIPLDTLVSCVLVLQRHTAWNVNVVLGLNADAIEGKVPPFDIQGYKERIQKPSPPVPVEAHDTDVLRSFDILIGRLDRLRQCEWVKPNEKSIWLAEKRVRGQGPAPSVGWGSALKTFLKRHGLPHFSLEQMRTQVLCLHGEQAGLEEMRRIANHQSITTTGSYAAQLLLHRKNAAVNLEFQRRLEREIQYLPDEGPEGNTSYLWPIGDGTSCADPASPPHEEYLEGFVCKAQACHEGDGCPNRRVHINRARIEEAVRTSHFFAKNWTRLLAENRAAFERFQLPSMIFNQCLIEVVGQGRYGYVVKEVRQQIDRELSQ